MRSFFLEGERKIALKARATISFLTTRRAAIITLAFSFPFVIRLIPQLIAWPNPLGYDIVATYAPFVSLVRQNGFAFETSHVLAAPMAPLMFLLLGVVGLMFPVSPFAIAAFAAPVLYGVLGLGVYSFTRGRLDWSQRDSLVAVLLMTLCLLPLRYSWDSLKDLLGVATFFAALGQVPRGTKRCSWSLFAILMSISVLTEEIETVLASALSCYMMLRTWRSAPSQRRIWAVTFLGCASLVILFSHILLPSNASPFPPYSALPKYLPFGNISAFGFVNYLGYGDVALAATLLIGLGMAPLALPIVRGYFRDEIIEGVVVLLSVATLSIYVPGLTANVWPTWLFLLSFPLILYAYRGFGKLERATSALLLLFVLLTSVGFLSLAPQNALPYLTIPQVRTYIPTSVMQNTIPLDRVAGVETIVAWLNARAGPSDVVAVSNAFYGFVQIDGKPMVLYPYYNVNTVDWKNFQGHHMIYSIAWSDNLAWYDGGPLPPAFRLEFSSNGVGVFQADPSTL